MNKKTTAERLNELMCLRGISKQTEIVELCQPLCKKYNERLGKNDLSQYISGKVVPGQRKLTILAEALNVSESWLMGYDVPIERNISNIIPLEHTKKIPLLGKIACGEPILAQENWENMILLPDGIDADFALRCQGDSMIDARINDGDIVFIKMQAQVDNGEIAVVLIDNEATLKRFYKQKDKVILKPENKDFQPFVYVGTEINDIRVIGKATYFLSEVK